MVPLSMPVVGDRLMEVFTVNVVEASLIPPVSLSNRVYGPAGNVGTMNQVVKLYAFVPVVRGVCEPNVVPGVANRLDRVPPRVAVATLVKPTTVTVTFVPTVADVTEVVIVGAPSMVKVELIALSVGPARVIFIV